MGWVADLESLPVIVAILVVFTACLSLVIRYISKHVVSPFKILIGNHLEHLTAEQKEDRLERCKMREALEKQTEVMTEQSYEFRRLCERINGKTERG